MPATETPRRLPPPCGPAPDGLERLTLDVPQRIFRELEQASRRRGVPLDEPDEWGDLASFRQAAGR